MNTWEHIAKDPNTKRLKIDGGYLYLVTDQYNGGMNPSMVFVPDQQGHISKPIGATR